MLKNYKFSFDIWGLVIFLIVMIPNFIWFAVPAPTDILRNESVTPIIDMIGSVLQVLFVGALSVIINKERTPLRFSVLMIFAIMSIVLYFIGWILYYNSFINPFVIILLTFTPCFAFVLFALDRKNMIAAVFATGFMICHLVYGIVNFMLYI